MRAIIKEPLKPAVIKNIKGDLADLHSIVGGYIEAVYLSDEIILICDEEGKLKNKIPNIQLRGDFILGTIIVVGTKGPDLRGLSLLELDIYLQYLQLCSF